MYLQFSSSEPLVLEIGFGPPSADFGQTWVFHKFGWVFHKFIENGEFYLGWFQSLTGIIETPGKNTKQSETKSTKKYLLFAKVDWEFLGGISEWHPALRDGLPKKVPVLLDFVQITFRPSLQLAKLVQFFSDFKAMDLKVSFDMNTLCIQYIYILK